MNFDKVHKINKALSNIAIFKKYRKNLRIFLDTITIGRYIRNTEKKTYEKYLLKDGYNLALREGNGETFLVASVIPEFERIYKAKVKLFIKPSHEYLMEMFNIKNYIVVKDFSKKTIYPIYINKTPSAQIGDVWFVKERYHPDTNKKIGWQHFRNFKEEIMSLLKLPLESKLLSVVNKPKISKEFKAKLNSHNSLDKIILFIPEANLKDIGDLKYWEKLAFLLKKAGCSVISNVICPEHHLKNASLNENFKMEDLIALGFACKAIVANRSGMCDVFNERGKNLFVFNTAYKLKQAKDFYNLNAMFCRNDINEYPDESAITPEDLVKKILGN